MLKDEKCTFNLQMKYVDDANSFHFLLVAIALCMGFFYNMYTHDREGIIGTTMRSVIQSTGIQGTMDDKLFATIVVTGFMQIAAFLMLPEICGPTFSLVLLPKKLLVNLLTSSSSPKVKKPPIVNKPANGNVAATKRKKNRNKKKTN